MRFNGGFPVRKKSDRVKETGKPSAMMHILTNVKEREKQKATGSLTYGERV